MDVERTKVKSMDGVSLEFYKFLKFFVGPIENSKAARLNHGRKRLKFQILQKE